MPTKAKYFSLEKKREIVTWMHVNGFVRSDPDGHTRPATDVAWEIAWPSDSGYSYITLHLDPGAYGFAVAIKDGHGEHRRTVCLGTVKSVSQLAAIYGVLSSMNYDDAPMVPRDADEG